MATLVRPLCMAAVAPARSQAWKSACWVAVVGMFPPSCRRLFFSSRRRHTIYWRDWSSDVCSSDLHVPLHQPAAVLVDPGLGAAHGGAPAVQVVEEGVALQRLGLVPRHARPAVRRREGGLQIGRASCRERVWISVGAGSLKKKTALS